jgi:DNA-binding SARP family transcriptional activator
VQRFESLLLEAEACTTPTETVRMLRVALDLWRGAPLEGITAAYAEAARARLQEQRLGATERLTDLELAAGRHAELIAPLMAQVAAHPLRGRLVGRLMLALYRNGRQSDALQAARDLRRRLADEEGIDPGADLVRLETAILRADPALDPPAIPPTSETAKASRVPHAQQAPQLLPPRPATLHRPGSRGRRTWTQRSSLGPP